MGLTIIIYYVIPKKERKMVFFSSVNEMTKMLIQFATRAPNKSPCSSVVRASDWVRLMGSTPDWNSDFFFVSRL